MTLEASIKEETPSLTTEVTYESNSNPANQTPATRTIIMPIDKSCSSAWTIKFAIEHIINPATDQVCLIFVRRLVHDLLPMPLSSRLGAFATEAFEGSGAELEMRESLEEEMRKDAHNFLVGAAKIFSRRGIRVSGISMKGEVRKQLNLQIDAMNPSMVIVGARGLSNVSSLLLGSTSRYLLHHLKVPVMVVPYAEEQHQQWKESQAQILKGDGDEGKKQEVELYRQLFTEGNPSSSLLQVLPFRHSEDKK